MEKAKKAMIEVAEEKAKQSPDFKKVWNDVYSFLQTTREWTDIGLKPYLKVRDS